MEGDVLVKAAKEFVLRKLGENEGSMDAADLAVSFRLIDKVYLAYSELEEERKIVRNILPGRSIITLVR